MSRVKRGVTARKKHKKILKLAKGYYGARSRTFRSAKQSVIKAHQYSYRDRKCKKRSFRRSWIIKINAAARSLGISYSNLIFKFKCMNFNLNRKMLSNLIINDFSLFKSMLDKISYNKKLC